MSRPLLVIINTDLRLKALLSFMLSLVIVEVSQIQKTLKKSSINLEWVVANSSSIVHLSLETFTLSGYVLYLLITC